LGVGRKTLERIQVIRHCKLALNFYKISSKGRWRREVRCM